MKPLLLFFALLLQSAGFVFGQLPCGMDSLIDHQPINVAMDTTAPPCYPFDCFNPTRCHSVQLADSFSGIVDFSNAGEFFEIIVVSDCHWVVHDTCAQITAQTPGFAFFNTFPPRATIIICGQIGSAVTVFSKSVPIMNYPPFRDTLIYLDTLCPPLLGVREPLNETIKVGECWIYENYLWSKIDCGIPDKKYFLK